MEPTFDFSYAYPDVFIATGTQTGNSEMVADHVAEVLTVHGFTPTVKSMLELELQDLVTVSQFIVVTSTYGEGALPDTAQEFYDTLVEEHPDLSHMAYGIIALGDTDYEEFAQAGIMFDEVLTASEAIGVIAMHTIDQGPTEEHIEEASFWALQCGEAFSAAFAD